MRITTTNIRKTIFLLLLGLFLVSFKNDTTKIDLVERIYVQTDRPLYFPGETIWFKAYVVNSANSISFMSEMVYADLISPKGSVVKTIRLAVRNGHTHGDFEIKKDWVGGLYTLKVYTNWVRNYGENHFFTKEITVQKIVQPKLLMNLEFEKEAYGSASEVVANFEVKDLKNQPLKNIEIHIAAMIQGKRYISSTLRTDDQGKANPRFVLPDTLTSRDALLNIMINFKGSTESISRSIPILFENIDLQFFPESGQLIAGTTNTVAFKAINEFGKPADIAGIIFTKQGVEVATFKSYHDGMGSFEFLPTADTEYYAQITEPFVSKNKILLPTVQHTGVKFSIQQQKEKVALSLFSSFKKSLVLTISNSAGTLASMSIKDNQKTLSIDTGKFPIGITKFTIRDTTKAILAERLVFINPHKQMHIKIDLKKEMYDTREKVALGITTKDENGAPISANLAIAVADNKLLSFADDKQDNIHSYLLLSSELRGTVHEPTFYFDTKEPKAKKALDYVMLTHGWRYYIVKNKVSLFNASFQPEQLAVQKGIIVDLEGNPKKAHLLLFDNSSKRVLTFETDETGKFSFKQSGSNRLTLVAYTDTNDPLYIRTRKPSSGFSSSIENKKGVPNPTTPKDFFGVEKPLQKTIKKEARANISLTEDAQSLDEVIVTGYGTTTKANATGSVVYLSQNELTGETNAARTLQGRVAGVQITTANGAQGAASNVVVRGLSSITGNSQPLFVVDGIPFETNGQTNLSTDNINSISVLKGLAATTLYGSRGSNGVVLISTNNRYYNQYGKKILNNRKTKTYTAANFYPVGANSFDRTGKFYIPRYEGTKLPLERSDFRPTIYWNPVVQTDENGKAHLEFYNSDAVTSFKITAEGIAYNGLLGRAEKEYATKKMLALDFKAPNYMTINDIVDLPLSITNETEKTLFTTLDLTLPKQLQLANVVDKNIVIPPGTTLHKKVRVLVMQQGVDLKIRAHIKSENHQDLIQKKVTVVSSHFPTATTISGTKSANFEFEVNNSIPNTLTADFIVYTDIVGEVMNGVASMIRQPYGCFEQVSSTTYPNVLVLKYLRKRGNVKRKIEKKALKYIADGYRRLVAYETSENGFEWYGHAPPHEALSAYGLLQFKEMSDVYPGVDQKMVQRTVRWLESRKDGKGGFLQNKGRYGFAAAPYDVNNAYIVYALSETNSNAKIEKEYQTAFANAIESLDTYKLALSALSSANLNNMGNFKVSTNFLKTNIKDYGFANLPVKNTITRSYGNSKNYETVAFTMLALLKDYEANELIIKNGVEYLLKSRRYGRFGSTQSTAMVLKVLISYADKQQKKIISKNDGIQLTINGKVVHQKIKLNEKGTIRIDSLAKYIKNGSQRIDVRFTNPEVRFPYSLNVRWDSDLPDASPLCKIQLLTHISPANYKVAEVVRMNVSLRNLKDSGLSMPTAIIGIPAGASLQTWQLKELIDEKKVAYYELFDNYLVLYWREMGPREVIKINLDLKADIAGDYTAPASTAYLYYGDEDKTWVKGAKLKILE